MLFSNMQNNDKNAQNITMMQLAASNLQMGFSVTRLAEAWATMTAVLTSNVASYRMLSLVGISGFSMGYPEMSSINIIHAPTPHRFPFIVILSFQFIFMIFLTMKNTYRLIDSHTGSVFLSFFLIYYQRLYILCSTL